MTIFTQSTLINYSSIKTHHYPIFQTLRIFLIGKYVNHFCIFFFHWNFFRFEQLTRECDVKFFTGFESTVMFKAIFNHVKSRAIVMRYWEGQKRASHKQKSNDLSTEHTNIILQSPKYNKVDIPVSRCGLIENLY